MKFGFSVFDRTGGAARSAYRSRKMKASCGKSLGRRRLLLESLEHRNLMAGDLWTQRGGDAGHTSYVDTTFDPAALGQAWNRAIPPSGTYNWHENAVAIDESRVYRTIRVGDSHNYDLLALDLQSGQEIWRQRLLGYPSQTAGEPSIAGGIVYVNRAGHSGISGGSDADWPRLYGFDADTGELVLQQIYSAQWGTNERPVIDGGQLFVEAGYYGGISAYDASSLVQQWHRPDGRGLYEPPFAALDDEYAYAFDNSVYRRTDGTRLPDIAHPTLAWLADPIVSDTGRVLFSTRDREHHAQHHYVSALNGDTHAHLWTASMPGFPQGKAVGNGVVAVTAGRDLIILNEADGARVQ